MFYILIFIYDPNSVISLLFKKMTPRQERTAPECEEAPQEECDLMREHNALLRAQLEAARD